jgi:hypothetical protein
MKPPPFSIEASDTVPVAPTGSNVWKKVFRFVVIVAVAPLAGRPDPAIAIARSLAASIKLELLRFFKGSISLSSWATEHGVPVTWSPLGPATYQHRLSAKAPY